MTTAIAPLRSPSTTVHVPLPGHLRDIESVLGFRPRDSVALRVHLGRDLFAVLRVDLPRSATRRAARGGGRAPVQTLPERELIADLAAAVETMVSRIRGATGFDVAGYGEVTHAERAVAAVSERLVLAGFVEHDSCLVVDDRWSRHSLAERSWQPFPPLEPESTPSDPHRGHFVPIRPIAAERRDAALAMLAGHEQHDESSQAAFENWAIALDPETPLDSDARAILLAWSLRDGVLRDSVLMLAAWGPDAAFRALAETLAGADTSADCGGPENAGAETGADAAVDPLRMLQAASAGSPSVLHALVGRGHDTPRASQIRRAVKVLRWVAECSPSTLSAPVLVLLAWLDWARGRGSAAIGYLDLAEAADPHYALARLFRRVVDSGRIPEWCGAR
jgi:hypothetical protein